MYNDISAGDNRSLSGYIEIDNNNVFIYQYECEIDIHVNNAVMMRFKNDGGDWSSWEGYSSKKTWNFDYPFGDKTVYGQFMNDAGDLIVLSDSITMIERITANDGDREDSFGYSVSLSSNGNTAVIGAYHDEGITDGFHKEQGSVYIATWNNSSWNNVKLYADDGIGSDEFGNSVSISGNGETVIVGAWLDDGDDSGFQNNQGAAYVFKKSGSEWRQVKKLQDDAGQPGDLFGKSVAISEDGITAVVGAHYHDSKCGAVYVFQKDSGGTNNWGLITKIQARAKEEKDFLGTSVSISSNGKRIIAGANGRNVSSGSIFIFDVDGPIVSEVELSPSGLASFNHFGISTSISSDGNIVAAGAYGRSAYRGSVFIYQWDGSDWAMHGNEVMSLDSMEGDHFGLHIDLSSDGKKLAVGSSRSDLSSSDQGAVYYFSWDSDASDYIQMHKLFTQDGSFKDILGSGIAMSSNGSIIIAGSNQKRINDNEKQGAVFVYRSL